MSVGHHTVTQLDLTQEDLHYWLENLDSCNGKTTSIQHPTIQSWRVVAAALLHMQSSAATLAGRETYIV